MDKLIILEFDTKQKADICLAVINQIAAAYWRGHGYTVINNQLVPKNADGTDNLKAQRTTTWDVVQESPDKTWYITDPAVNPNFVAWEERAGQAGYKFDGTRKPYPKEWVQEIE